MRADYKNWVPKGMVYGFIAATCVLVLGFVTSMILTRSAGAPVRIGLNLVLGLVTLACAKRNPKAQMKGIDRWGKEYASFSKKLCESNSKAEGVNNTSFAQGDAVHLDFADETFDAVTSNYVYHNIGGVNKQDLLLETLRVLKKGGTFAIHDIMSEGRYGDMRAFTDKLKKMGY